MDNVIPDKILGCPFCGSAALLHNMSKSYHYFIGCDNHVCKVQPGVRGESIYDVITTWNKRHD